MRQPDEKNKIFLDMLQHPEKYSDRQIETVMSEQDKPVDVEAEWNDFCNKTIGRNNVCSINGQQTRSKSVRWWHAIAVVAVAVVGMCGLLTLTDKEDGALLANYKDGGEYLDSIERDISVFVPSQNLEPQKLNNATKPATQQFAENKTALPDNIVRVRGKNSTMHDKEGVLIVNGQKLQRQDMYYVFNQEDIKSINVWKDDAKTETYVARYGNQVKYGVIEIFLKKGRELAYADILGNNPDSDGVFNAADKMPSYPGGRTALDAYLKENLKSPSVLQDSALCGQVVISFVVEKNGKLTNFKWHNLLKNGANQVCADSAVTALCADEAFRICRMMPRWTPGAVHTDDGYKNVRVRYFLPLSFGNQRKAMRLR